MVVAGAVRDVPSALSFRMSCALSFISHVVPCHFDRREKSLPIGHGPWKSRRFLRPVEMTKRGARADSRHIRSRPGRICFAPRFRRTRMQPTLFQQALGAAYFRLPGSVRRLHALRGRARWTGLATIERGRNPLARLCARVVGLPGTAREVATTVDFAADAGGETWQRDFGGQRMRTRLVFRDGLLRERLGPLQLRHALHANDGAIWWTVAGARLFGLLPLPASLFEGVRCREFESQERYHFEVDARLPLAGLVVRYSGWLAPE